MALFLPNFFIFLSLTFKKRFFILTFPNFNIQIKKVFSSSHFLHISQGIVSFPIESQGFFKIEPIIKMCKVTSRVEL